MDLLKELNMILLSNAKNPTQDLSFALVTMRTAYETTILEARNDFMRQAAKQLALEGKDDYFAKTIDEMIEV